MLKFVNVNASSKLVRQIALNIIESCTEKGVLRKIN